MHTLLCAVSHSLPDHSAALHLPGLMRLSAIIPTHNRPAALSRCLETLQAQQVDPARLEVVVVDDGSEIPMSETVARASSAGPVSIRCERQSLTGLNGSRNRGASLASGDVLAFLDDDTLVSPGWAQALLDAFERYPCAAVGGRVELGLAGPAPAWMAGRRYFLAEYELGPEPHWLDTGPAPIGANCAIRRSDFDRVAGFQLGLDRLAGSLLSNGDTDFFDRLRAAGGRFRYEPRAHVIHTVPAERLTVEFFARRSFAQGVSDELLFALHGGIVTLGYRAMLVRGLGSAAFTFLKDVVRGQGTEDARFAAHYWAGRLSSVGKAPAGAALGAGRG